MRFFDYLDDASLLVAQHFLLELMKQFKDAGKSIDVVILTHLDPSQLKSFRFKKFHASYISPVVNGAEKGCLHKILVDRRRCQKSSSIFTRRYLRITCTSPIARRCPKMFEHMLRNKCSEMCQKSRRRFATRWSRSSETASPRSLSLHRRRAAESGSQRKDPAMKHWRRKKPSKNIWKSRKAPRKGFVMRKRMVLKCPRRFACWVPSITAACIFLMRQGNRRSFKDNSGAILSGI